jgi:hypothetical protein
MYIVYERRMLVVVFPITVWIASAGKKLQILFCWEDPHIVQVTGCIVLFEFSRADTSSNPGYFAQNVVSNVNSPHAL